MCKKEMWENSWNKLSLVCLSFWLLETQGNHMNSRCKPKAMAWGCHNILSADSLKTANSSKVVLREMSQGLCAVCTYVHRQFISGSVTGQQQCSQQCQTRPQWALNIHTPNIWVPRMGSRVYFCILWMHKCGELINQRALGNGSLGL